MRERERGREGESVLRVESGGLTNISVSDSSRIK